MVSQAVDVSEKKYDQSHVKSGGGKMLALSREARSNQRRLLTAFGTVTDSDLLKFNGLKVCSFVTYNFSCQ